MSDPTDGLQVVRSGDLAGAVNMGLDEALLELAAGDARPGPWLRLYGWVRPTLSFGHHQRPADRCDLAAARLAGVDLVRRPTGGKALLHQHELTYAVVLPAGHPVARLPVEGSHGLLAGALARALRALGAPVEVARPAGSGDRAATRPCFEEHLAESLVVGGRKVAGSAQLRRHGAVLQHGSILLALDLDLHERLFGRGEAGFRATFAQAAAGLADVMVSPPAREALEVALARELAVELAGGRLAEAALPAATAAFAARLAAMKYASLEWRDREGAQA